MSDLDEMSAVTDSGDAIDSYFECITSCSIGDEEQDCITQCIEVHLKKED